MSDRTDHVSIGILPGTEIRQRIDELIKFGDVSRVESCSYDMCVGTIFRGLSRINCDTQGNQNVELQPGEFVHIFTKEELTLPADISVTAYAINARSSKGLLVLNPGHVDPGFSGPLTVTAWNLNNRKETIQVGDKIITALFTRLETAAVPYVRNRNRSERESEFTNHVNADASTGIGELIAKNLNRRIATKEDIDALETKLSGAGWAKLNWIIAIASGVVAVASLAVSIIGLWYTAGPNSSAPVAPAPGAPAPVK